MKSTFHFKQVLEHILIRDSIAFPLEGISLSSS
jgi:hypothetical protein